MKYAYEVGYHTEEPCGSNTLIHDKLFSKEEFDDVVSESYALCYIERDSKYENNTEYLHNKVVQKLITNHGFQPIEYIQRFETYGWDEFEEHHENKPNHEAIIKKISMLEVV